MARTLPPSSLLLCFASCRDQVRILINISYILFLQTVAPCCIRLHNCIFLLILYKSVSSHYWIYWISRYYWPFMCNTVNGFALYKICDRLDVYLQKIAIGHLSSLDVTSQAITKIGGYEDCIQWKCQRRKIVDYIRESVGDGETIQSACHVFITHIILWQTKNNWKWLNWIGVMVNLRRFNS